MKHGDGIKTHDFLQPLEQRVAEGYAKEEKSSPPHEALPGGIGTYTITSRHNSNPCFTLWGDNKGKTGKENNISGQWGSSSEWPSQSSSNNHHANYSSLSSSIPSGHRSQSFMDMIKSMKGCTNHEDEENNIALKIETTSSATLTPEELKIKVDGKSSDQANTPRSKHSATEQRRRSKINDRFKMLRELIPHGDQKRDKASFLLEVIEYIQFLQEKVQKYEGPYQGWSNEQTKSMPWRSSNSGPAAALLFATEFDEKPLPLSQAVQSDSTLTNKGLPFPVSMQPNLFTPVRDGGGAVPPVLLRHQSDLENTSTQPRHQLRQTRSCTTVDGDVSADKLKEKDLTIETGTISISSAYSQGLLNVLTQALQSSGIDLSQASVSVQIELGKRANRTTSVTKGNETSPSNQARKHSMTPTDDDSDQPRKKFKTSKN